MRYWWATPAAAERHLPGCCPPLAAPTAVICAMNIDEPFFALAATAFRPMGIVWWRAAGRERIRQVFLGKEREPAAEAIRKNYPQAVHKSSGCVEQLSGQLQRFLSGEPVTFDLSIFALEFCGDFQRRVLLAEYGIPRGRVSTYGRIAQHIGVSRASRAVGRALAANPFPIVIPCHRAVRADGSLGGYQGGTEMKKSLLEMEGVQLAPDGKSIVGKFYY